MYCRRCGAKLQKGQKFCHCGECVVDYTDIDKYDELPKLLKIVCIAFVWILLVCAIIRVSLYMFSSVEFATSLVMWMRFMVIFFAVCGFECIILDKIGTIRAKALTALVILGVTMVALNFLLPQVSSEYIWSQIFGSEYILQHLK